jgi:hypothetical protein
MAITIKWIVPANNCSFDFVYIYRSNNKLGTYTNIANQSIDDNSYCDLDGGLNNWYKVRFYDSVALAWDDYSQPMQGGTYAGYSSVDSVREISNLTVDDICDTDLYNLIQRATAYLNAEINFRVIREYVVGIDQVRLNQINGTNTTFYVRRWRQHIGDMNNDGKVTTSDLIVYQVDSQNVETQLPVATISPDEGMFTLYTPPAQGSKVYVTYEWCYVSEFTPHPLVKLACDYLTTAFAFEKVERGLSPQQIYGNVRIYRDMAAGSDNHRRYREVVLQINSELLSASQAPNFADLPPGSINYTPISFG